MPRIRSIKPDFWTSEDIVSVSRDARLLFIGMWNHADDEGNGPVNPLGLKMKIFPGDLDITIVEIEILLNELNQELIAIYKVDDKLYYHITGWSHQKISHPQPAKYPPFTERYLNAPEVVHPDLIGSDRIVSDRIGEDIDSDNLNVPEVEPEPIDDAPEDRVETNETAGYPKDTSPELIDQVEKMSKLFYRWQIEKFPNQYTTKESGSARELLEINGAKALVQLVNIDGFSLDDITLALSFALKDEFWKKNLFSLQSLRRKKDGRTKYQNIVAAMERDKPAKRASAVDVARNMKRES